VVVLNKADLCDDVETCLEQVGNSAIGVPIYVMTALEKEGLDCVKDHIKNGRTAVFLGSSGVGKSTIINGLFGEERLKTAAVREYDGKGRHTTTSREMHLLPGGGIVIDTPGLREIQAWDDEEGIERTFADIEQLASQCRFTDCAHQNEPDCDCAHQNEPDCAVIEAIKNGDLDPGRFRSYIKLQKEIKYMSIRKDQRARIEESKKWKKITVAHRQRAKLHRKRKGHS